MPKIDLRDVFGVVGFALLETGVAMLSVSAAFITAGVLFLAVAVLPVLRRVSP